MLRRFALLGCLAAAACGGEGSWQRCGSSAECPTGTFCNVPVTGEQGVCQAPATVALTAPAPGAFVGAGATFSATLTLASAGITAPASVGLRLGRVVVATLGMQGTPAGQVATYSGTWTPGAAQNGPGSLDVLATVDAAGTPVPVSSPAVPVIVDTLPPAIPNATAACAGGCKRDSTLDISADVTDTNLLAVAVSLDLGPGLPVAVTRGGGDTWSASVALGQWAFPHFQRTVQVTVRAADRAGNEATAVLPVDVTRLRWAYTSGATAVTSPAVMADGTIVFGVSATSGQLRALNPDMSEAFPPVTVGAQAVTAAPSLGPTAIWVASNDGKIYAVGLGSGILNGTGCSTGSATVGSPALSLDNPELSFTGSTTNEALFTARVPSFCDGTSVGEAFVGSAAVGGGGHIFAATASATGTQAIRRFTDPGTGFLSADWAVGAGIGTDVPLAIDGSGRVLASSFDANLYRITDNGGSGSAELLATLSGRPNASPVVLASGDIVVGCAGGGLHRLTAGGAEVWIPAPDLVADVTGVAAAVPGGTTDPILFAVTALGKVFAIRADGSEAWSGQVAAGALRDPSIAPGAGNGLPTLYAGSADGSLYAVVVDSPLDASAPWPKAHHDLANTANASSPLP